MIDEYTYRYLEMYFPDIVDRMVDSYPYNTYGHILVLNDGQKVLYDFLGQAIRPVPNDISNISEEEFCNEFGYRLQRKMQLRGIGQKELAELTGMSQAQISNYVRGSSMPTVYKLSRIAKALNCSIDDFMYT